MAAVRILTNRDFPDGSWEAIEMVEREGRQLFFWRGWQKKIECCFPVPMQFVKEKFAELGREYRESGREKYKDYANFSHGS